MPRKTYSGEKPQYKNVSFDADILDILASKQDELQQHFGFRPTLSQTVRYMFKKEHG